MQRLKQLAPTRFTLRGRTASVVPQQIPRATDTSNSRYLVLVIHGVGPQGGPWAKRTVFHHAEKLQTYLNNPAYLLQNKEDDEPGDASEPVSESGGGAAAAAAGPAVVCKGVEWYSSAIRSSQLPFALLDRITPSYLFNIRQIANQTGLEVLLFNRKKWRSIMVANLCREMNKTISEFIEQHPTRFEGGRVILFAHSLGSALAYELLKQQQQQQQQQQQSQGTDSSGTSCKLHHRIDSLVCVGCPIGVFGVLDSRVHHMLTSDRDHEEESADMFAHQDGEEDSLEGILTSLSELNIELFNIMHPFDPLAYRIEPLLSKELGELSPVLLPHTGRYQPFHIYLQNVYQSIQQQTERQELARLLPSMVNLINLWHDAGTESSVQPPPKQQQQQQQQKPPPEPETVAEGLLPLPVANCTMSGTDLAERLTSTSSGGSSSGSGSVNPWELDGIEVFDLNDNTVRLSDTFKDQRTLLVLADFVMKLVSSDSSLAGVKLVAVGNGSKLFARGFVRTTGWTGEVYRDPESNAFRSLHLKRFGFCDYLSCAVCSRYREAGKLKNAHNDTNGDGYQSGGFFVVGPSADSPLHYQFKEEDYGMGALPDGTQLQKLVDALRLP